MHQLETLDRRTSRAWQHCLLLFTLLAVAGLSLEPVRTRAAADYGADVPVPSRRRLAPAETPSHPGAVNQPAQPPGPAKLPPPSAGVTDLKFCDFFEPIGARGLNYSPLLKSLDGHQVRILGYMVKQEITTPGLFLLAPVPVKLEEDEMGLADDLPAGVVHVLSPVPPGSDSHHIPGPLVLTGTLRLGTREEADGRLSSVRLVLEWPVSTTNKLSAVTASALKPAL